jgi:short-subunit dehydrogenase
MGPAVPATQMTWEKVKPTLQLNVMGTIATLTGALPSMLARGEGHLAAVSSLAGIRGLPTSATYSASKGAISIFLQAIRIDLRKTKIRVTDRRRTSTRCPSSWTSRTRPR